MRRYIKVELTPSECRSFVLERLKEIIMRSLADEILDLDEGRERDNLEERITSVEFIVSFTAALEVMRTSNWNKEAAFRLVLEAVGDEQEQLNESWEVLVNEWDT